MTRGYAQTVQILCGGGDGITHSINPKNIYANVNKREKKTYGVKAKVGDAPSFMADTFLNDESRNIGTMPMLKICTLLQDM
jgi:hypothetical protein